MDIFSNINYELIFTTSTIATLFFAIPIFVSMVIVRYSTLAKLIRARILPNETLDNHKKITGKTITEIIDQYTIISNDSKIWKSILWSSRS